MSKHQTTFASLLALALAGGLVAACSSSNDNPAPGGGDVDSGIPTTDTGTGGKDTGGGGADTTPGGDTGPATDTGPKSDSGGGDADAGGCFAGTPTTDVQFFNACTSATCVPYDNSKLKHLNPDGTLPPLP